MTHIGIVMGHDLGDDEQGQLHTRQEQDELNQTQPSPPQEQSLREHIHEALYPIIELLDGVDVADSKAPINETEITLLSIVQESNRQARIDENWLLAKQAHKVADENGGSLRKTKVSLEAIVYWSRARIKALKDHQERKDDV